MLHAFLSYLLNLIYPKTCFYCDNPSYSNWCYICKECSDTLEIIQDPSCVQCGARINIPTLHSDSSHTSSPPTPIKSISLSQPEICQQCQTTKRSFNNGISLFQFVGIGKFIVYSLKYYKGFYTQRDIFQIALLKNNLKEFISNAILVPVPLHWIKEWRRGYNQSLLIAKTLQKIGHNTQILNLLKRNSYTRSQTSLNKEKRLKNVKNAFALRKNFTLNNSQRYILIDDVFTTGATLDACAKVLKKHGAKFVDVLTLAHG